MASPLAFDLDPLFSKLSEPLVKVATRLTQERQRLWCWKKDDFFWFWNKDRPDFFGVFFDATDRSGVMWLRNRSWFERAALTTDSKHLREILQGQLHHGEWARAITVRDPRPQKDGIWRILWRRREFLLQNASTGRAVRFFPETNWDKNSTNWSQLNYFHHDAQFFAEMFWPLLTERRGRLRTAFEFLELPIGDQKNPIRFGRGDHEEFLSVMGAALTINHEKHSWSEQTASAFGMRFHHRTFAPLFDFSGLIYRSYTNGCYVKRADIPKLERLAGSFEPYLPSNFSLQSVLPSPLTLFAAGYEPSIQVSVQGPFTAHEQIESFLTVRDWVFQNAPELLPEWSQT